MTARSLILNPYTLVAALILVIRGLFAHVTVAGMTLTADGLAVAAAAVVAVAGVAVFWWLAVAWSPNRRVMVPA